MEPLLKSRNLSIASTRRRSLAFRSVAVRLFDIMSMRLHLAAIILAAGRARRMGKPKLLCPGTVRPSSPTRSKPGATSTAPTAISVDVRIVVGARPDPIQDELDRLHFPETSRIINATPDDGMFSSIRCAARAQWPDELTHFAIILGDQPHLKKPRCKSSCTSPKKNSTVFANRDTAPNSVTPSSCRVKFLFN